MKKTEFISRLDIFYKEKPYFSLYRVRNGRYCLVFNTYLGLYEVFLFSQNKKQENTYKTFEKEEEAYDYLWSLRTNDEKAVEYIQTNDEKIKRPFCRTKELILLFSGIILFLTSWVFLMDSSFLLGLAILIVSLICFYFTYSSLSNIYKENIQVYLNILLNLAATEPHTNVQKIYRDCFNETINDILGTDSIVYDTYLRGVKFGVYIAIKTEKVFEFNIEDNLMKIFVDLAELESKIIDDLSVEEIYQIIKNTAK